MIVYISSLKFMENFSWTIYQEFYFYINFDYIVDTTN